MNKREIKKTFYEHVKFVEDDFLTADFRQRVGNAKILKYQYKSFIMYFPVNYTTAKGKTPGELFKMFLTDFMRNYNEFLLQHMKEQDNA